VELQPGEIKTISIPLDFCAFAFYHPEYKQWITESGDFDILIAASATDIRHTLTATLQSTLRLPCILDKESTLREWTVDPRGSVVFAPVFEKMTEMSRRTFGGDGETEGMGMDIMDMLMDMPLMSVLLFQQRMWPMPADELVSELLAQAQSAS
jgi:beta-glucosidase